MTPQAVRATREQPSMLVTRDLAVHGPSGLAAGPIGAAGCVRRGSSGSVVIEVDVRDDRGAS